MTDLINTHDKIFVAGAYGMAGSAICRALQRNGYGNNARGGSLLKPTRQELDLLNTSDVNTWYHHNKPNIVINFRAIRYINQI